jgi:hypothetical protein
LFRVRKSLLIPCEVFLVLSVFDVQPDRVTRDVMLGHLLRDLQGLLLRHVIPPALMITETKHGRHRHLASQQKELVRIDLRRVTCKEEEFQCTTFTVPMRCPMRRVTEDVHKGIRGVCPQETRGDLVTLLACLQHRDRTIECVKVELVLEMISVE